MNLPKLSEPIVQAGTTPQSFQRGKELYQRDAVSSTTRQDMLIRGQCEGSMMPYYAVQVALDEGGIRSAHCTCEYEYGGFCKHAVALLLAFVHQPEQFVAQRSPDEMLANLDRDDLAALMTQLLRDHPHLSNWVEAALATPPTKNKAGKPVGKPKRKNNVDVSVYRRQVRSILRSLDNMRTSEAYGYVGGLTSELRQVQEAAMSFLDAGDPDSALAILMVLAEELHQGIEYVDDSDGYLGDYALGLGLPMAETILSMNLSKIGRTKLIEKLKKLDAELDSYGTGGLDVAVEAATYGWEADPPGKPTVPQTMLTSTTWQEYDEDDELVDEGVLDDRHPFLIASGQSTLPAHDLTEAKLNVLNRRGDNEAYLALCKQAQRHLRCVLKLCDLDRASEAVSYAKATLNSTQDALEVSKRLRDLGRVEDAITIGELGLTLPGHKAFLGEWLGPIEETQNRPSQALQAWRAAFTDSPKLETYKTLKRLNQADWPALQAELMQGMRQSFSRQTLVEVLLFEAQWDEAIAIADERTEDYRLAELVAEGVMKERPAWVITASRKQAEALIAKTQSKYYVHAAEWLRRMKQAYSLMAKSREWQTYLDGLKEQYRRRPALQAQLRGL